MILSYLEEAMTLGYDPALDDEALARERVAALRLYLWTELAVGGTALKQTERNRQPAVKRQREQLVAILMPEYRVPEHEQSTLNQRTVELTQLHRDEEDCRIVGEAELLQANWLITFDKKLKRRLDGEARVKLRSPSELWNELQIPRGTRPIREPDPTNRLSGASFWRWD